MKLKNRLNIILWVSAVFLLIFIGIQQFTYFKIAKHLDEKIAVDQIITEITSLLVYEGGATEDALNGLENKIKIILSNAKNHPDLYQLIQDDIQLLESTIVNLKSTQFEKSYTSKQDSLMAEQAIKSNVITKRLLAEIKKFSLASATQLRRNVLITGMIQNAILLTLFVIGFILLFRFIKNISKSLTQLSNQIASAESSSNKFEAEHSKIVEFEYDEILQIASSFQGLISKLQSNKKSLQSNRDLLEGIFDAVNIGLCQVDRNGKFVRVNDKYCEIYGFTKEELIGEKITKVLPEEQHSFALLTFRKLMESPADQQEHPSEWQVVNRRGEIFDILTTTTIVDLENERFQIASILDITAHKEDRHKLDVAIDSGQIGTWYLDLRSDTLSVNKYWANMLGYSLEEVEPKQSFFLKLIHPDDRKTFEEVMDKVQQEDFNKFNFKIRMKTKSNTYIWILDSGMVTKRDFQGQPLVMAGTHINLDREIELRRRLDHEVERLRESQKTGKLGDWLYDVRTNQTTWSRQLYEIFEWPYEQDAPDFENLLKFCEEKDAEKLKEAIKKAIEENIPYDFNTVIKVENRRKYIRSIGTPVKDSAGEIVFLRGIVQDLTEQQRLEDEKQNYLERLNAISENIPGTIFQYKLKPDGTDQMLFVSEGAKKLWGYTPEEIMKDNTLVWNQFYEADLPLVQESIGLSAQNLSTWYAQWRNVNLDGSVSWLEGKGIPFKENNDIIWNSIILDITQRKATELKLEERERYLKTFYDNAFDAIMTSNASGKITFINKRMRQWIGEIRSDIAPKDYPSAMGFHTFDELRKLKDSETSLNMVLQKGELQNHRFSIKNAFNTSTRFVEANGARIMTEQKEVLGALIIIRDITESVKHNQVMYDAVIEASENERVKIALELHDNVTQTLGMSKMNLNNLNIEFPELEKNQHFMKTRKMISKSIDDVRHLSHSLMPLSVEDFGIVTVIQDRLNEIDKNSKIAIKFTVNEDMRFAKNIELNLIRITQEAVSNVLKHAKASILEISLFLSKEKIELNVKDNGIGISYPSSTNSNNVGIGMITMKNRIKQIGGNFQLITESEGTHLRFTLKPTDENE